MKVDKIKDLIAELQAEVNVKIQALNALQALLLEETSVIPEPRPVALKVVPVGFVPEESDSYVDLTVKIIEANAGMPMSVKDIVSSIRTAKGNPHIERRSVEATLYQHTRAKGDSSRVMKAGRGMYALRRYPRVQNSA